LVEQHRAEARAAEQAKVDAARDQQRARAEAERSAAESSKARAEAERATAAAEVARADAEKQRTEQKRDAEAARVAQEKADLALKLGTTATGVGTGFVASKFANKTAMKSIAAAAPQLAGLADEVRKLAPKAKAGSSALARLAGAVHTFDAQKLSRLR